jgi:hypothetical protein
MRGKQAEPGVSVAILHRAQSGLHDGIELPVRVHGVLSREF